MARTYTGSEIVAKVLKATKLIDKGTPLKEVWSNAKITRQTYNRWKNICDSIYSNFKAQADDTSKKLTSAESKILQLTEQLEVLNSKLNDTRKENRNLKRQRRETTLELSNTSGKLKMVLGDLKAQLMTRAATVKALKKNFQAEGKRYHQLLKAKLADCSLADSCNKEGSWVGKVCHRVTDTSTKHSISSKN